MRIAGVMSGTSLDGIDVAIVEVRGRQVETIGFTSSAYPAAVRARNPGSFELRCHAPQRPSRA